MTAAPPGPDLFVDALTHRFDRVTALEAISLEIGGGEILALLGPSGCGKSTLLRLIAGLETIQRGAIAIGGRTVSAAASGLNLPPERRDVGFLFQDYALFPHLNAADNVAFGLQHLGDAERRKRVGEVLERVGVSALADAFPHTLSGGQQQRVALARALAPSPGMLLLDEPLSGLDARLRHGLADTLLAILRETGTTAVVVTHDPEEAMYVADRIGVMRDGRLMQFGAPAAVYDRPANPFVANFLSDFQPVDRHRRKFGRNRHGLGAGRCREPAGRRRGADSRSLRRRRLRRQRRGARPGSAQPADRQRRGYRAGGGGPAGRNAVCPCAGRARPPRGRLRRGDARPGACVCFSFGKR